MRRKRPVAAPASSRRFALARAAIAGHLASMANRLEPAEEAAVASNVIFQSLSETIRQVILPAALPGIVGSLLLLFFRTSFGLRLRATTQNRDMSACLGVPVRRIDAQAFLLGTGIAGVAGWAMTLIGNVVPNMGQNYIVDSFLVVVTGGVGKLEGTVSAGLGIGILNKVLEPTF